MRRPGENLPRSSDKIAVLFAPLSGIATIIVGVKCISIIPYISPSAIFMFGLNQRGAASFLSVALMATLLSAGAEVLQVYQQNRFPSATDVCSNAIGSLLGTVIASRRVMTLP